MSATDCIAAWFAERWGWSHAVQLTDADELLRVLSDAGYHVVQDAIYRRMRHGDELLTQVEDGDVFVVQEGQAVVDGKVCAVLGDRWWRPDGAGGAYYYRLRPLPEPPPVVDEMTTTTTTKEGE